MNRFYCGFLTGAALFYAIAHMRLPHDLAALVAP